MSTGAVFKLIANDGKADRMIMATKLLNQRIKDVMCARNTAGKADITPTLTDLERTHILYVNAHFKPFAAIGYEYNKVRPQSGNAQLGSGVTFSIPQFGDFFHDMVCRVRLSGCVANSQKTPQQAPYTSPAPSTLSAFPANVNYVAGITSNVTYNIVDPFGNVLVSSANYVAPYSVNYRNFVRYCEYPGNRLFTNVKFDVNGNPLDAYDEMVPVMLEKFCTPPHKRAGYDRLVGQEVPMIGYGGLDCARVLDQDYKNTPQNQINRAIEGQSNQTVALFGAQQLVGAPLPPGVTGEPTVVLGFPSTAGQTPSLPGVNGIVSLNPIPLGSPLTSVVMNQFDVSRKENRIFNGPQTPRPAQPPLEIWNKLRFWFNDDVRLAIPSVAIPFGQRFISIDLCPQAALVYEFPAIYLETTLEMPKTTSSDGLVLLRKTYSPIMQSAGISPINVERIELYINNIFLNPEIHDIYIKRIGFSLIRVYRQQRQPTNSQAGEILLSQLKWPIEYMFIGMRPQWNISQSNSNQWRDWHRLTRVVDAVSDSTIGNTVPADIAPYIPNSTTAGSPPGATINLSNFQGASISQAPFCQLGSYVGKVMPDQYYLPVPTVDTLALTSHGISIYDNFSDLFFNSYMPFHYGGTSLCTPDDVGALFVNMALFPRSYQPSGHLNVSRARETYIKWSSSYIDTKSYADLLIVGVALNFLLITDGSAVLRYST